MKSEHMRNKLLFILTALGMLLAFGAPVLAECKTHYDEAVSILNGAKQKSLSANTLEKSEIGVFEGEFKGVVDKMQSEKCLPELMTLIQFIQSEQQKYPDLDGSTNPMAPITD